MFVFKLVIDALQKKNARLKFNREINVLTKRFVVTQHATALDARARLRAKVSLHYKSYNNVCLSINSV